MKTVRLLAFFLCIVMAGTLIPARSQAQSQNPALGLVGKSSNGRIGNLVTTEGSTVFSGDHLNTPENGTLLVRVGGLSLELQASSSAHIYRAPYGAIVELNRGTVIYNTPGTEENLVIVASDIRVTPAATVPDMGRVTIDDPCDITVYSQRGRVTVQAGSETRVMEEGKAYRVRALNNIGYNKFLSPDDDDYHRFHEHRPCAPVEMVKGRPPVAPGQSHFLLVSAALIGGATGVGLWKALESPDRP
ncbi:MAG TPA: hypothetical protein VMH81_33865 [Bryobacteraceae bacterium]|nr:hypothetical protein [Bryobacteraceae bacterium]